MTVKCSSICPFKETSWLDKAWRFEDAVLGALGSLRLAGRRPLQKSDYLRVVLRSSSSPPYFPSLNKQPISLERSHD